MAVGSGFGVGFRGVKYVRNSTVCSSVAQFGLEEKPDCLSTSQGNDTDNSQSVPKPAPTMSEI